MAHSYKRSARSVKSSFLSEAALRTHRET